jgi:hypothetical protein
MGTRIPSTSVPNPGFGVNAEKMKWLQEKRSWQHDRGVQGAKSLDILRYTTSGGQAYALVEPTYSQVSGLDNLPCYYDETTKAFNRFEKSFRDEATCVFILYDVPGGVTKQDIIEFDGEEYVVLDANNNFDSGRMEVLSKLL